MAQPLELPTPRVRRAASAMSSGFALCSFVEDYTQTLCYGLIYLENKMTTDDMKSIAQERMLPNFPRLRSKVVYENGTVFFEELALEDLDLDYHVSYLSEDKISADEARGKLAPFYKQGLDVQKPLWRVFIVPELDDGSCLAVFQIDHAIGDGSGLREIMYSVADPMDEELIKKMMSRPKKRVTGPKMTDLRLSYNFAKGVFEGMTGLMQPEDSPNRLKVPDIYNSSGDRRMAATSAIPLADVKEVKNSFAGATVNDVAMTVYTMMIQRYLENSGDKITGDELIRACYPVDLRDPRKKITHVGNNFGIQNFQLDLKSENRVDLFWKVKTALDNAKTKPTPLVLKWLADNVLPYFPNKMQIEIGIKTMGAYTGMLSNVIGPPVPIKLGGNTVKDIEIYVHSEIGSYFGIFSYNDNLTGTVTLDGAREPFPQKLTNHWNTEFEALLKEVQAEKAKQGVDVLFPARKTNFLDNPNSIYLVAFLLIAALAILVQLSL